MAALIVVVSRYQNVSFPGRPLAMIRGKSVIERTVSLARSALPLCAAGEARVVVATDDERVADHVRRFGGEPMMTSGSCANNTVRAFEAVSSSARDDDIVVVVEGNQVLVPPWIVAATVNECNSEPMTRIVTPMLRLSQAAHRRALEARRAGEDAGTFVVSAKNGNALYFSRAIIPAIRSPREPLPAHFHIPIFAYRMSALREYVSFPVGELEEVEGLEQLRALEHGIPIRVIEADYRGRTHCVVEVEEDVKRIESIIDREGELTDPVLAFARHP